MEQTRHQERWEQMRQARESQQIAFEGEVDKYASKVKGKYGDDITGKLVDILLEQFDEKDQMDEDICESDADDSAIMDQLTWAKSPAIMDQNTAKSLFAFLKLIVEEEEALALAVLKVHQQREEALAAFKDDLQKEEALAGLKDHQQKQKQSQQNPGSSRTRAAAIQRATPKQNDERPSNAMIGEYESKEFDDVSKVKAAPAKKDKKAAKKANSKADDSDEEGSSFDDSSHSDDEKEDVSKVKAAPAKKDAKLKPAEKMRLIGRYLFALTKIQDVEPRLAGKTGRTIVTGMLLEMDNTEVLVLLSDQRALMNKINEALAVLKDHQQKQLRLHLEKHESKEAESKVKAAPAKKDKKAGWNPIQKMTAALRRRDAANALGEFMRSEDEEL